MKIAQKIICILVILTIDIIKSINYTITIVNETEGVETMIIYLAAILFLLPIMAGVFKLILFVIYKLDGGKMKFHDWNRKVKV